MSDRRPLSAAVLAASAALGFALAPAASRGQEAGDVRTPAQVTAMVRGSGVIGLPDIAIDLDQRADKRYAVVVGNSAYDFGEPLRNALNDARLVAGFLRRQGYVVLDRYDLTRRGFEELLREALTEIPLNSEVVFYFAGHGLQIGRKNYLVPTDADLSKPTDVAYETVTLDSVVNILGARSRAQVVILDSCRDNPYGRVEMKAEVSSRLFEGQDGFSPMSAPVNTLLAFSTSPGAVALDGEGENSPFTSALVQAAEANADAPASSVLEQVRRAVYTTTQGRQVPWESSTLVEPVYFGGAAARSAAMSLPAAGAAPAGGASRSIIEVAGISDAAPQGPAGPAGAPARLSAPLEREIRIGAALAEALDLPEGGGLEVVSLPDRGRLALSGAEWRPIGVGPITGRELASLSLNPSVGQIPAEGHSGLVTESFEVIAKGERRRVELSMLADPCDLAAGDHLDPEGVGFVRYPNEIAPAEALAACTAAAEEQPEEGRFHYQKGRALLALRRFDEARAAYDEARKLGHTRAWYATGILEAQRPATTGGEAETRADDKVLVWYVIGSEKGDPYAYHALGKQFLRHENSPALRTQGYDLLTRAIQLGHTFAMNELGWIFLNKESRWHDPERGLRHLRESAARGDIYGYNNLGLYHRNGWGADGEKNMEAALAWFKKASEGGHPNAPSNVGRMYWAGEVDGKKDALKAIRWYDEGLSRGDAWGGSNAAFIIARAKPAGFGLADAALRAGKAAALRNAGAAEQAKKLLARMKPRTLDTATQMILNEMGAQIAADGAFGPGSVAALERMAAAGREAVPEGLSPVERLIFAAKLNWAKGRFRVDLY